MSGAVDAESWPNWLVAVTVRVDELAANPSAMERFRRMLRDWRVEHGRQGPKSRVDKDGYIRPHPVEILPPRRLSLAVKYASLAAIHDAICEKVERIDPWAGHKRFRRTGLPKARAAIPYAVLCTRVGDLANADRERVESVLRDVESDLAHAAEEPDAEKRRREPPLGHNRQQGERKQPVESATAQGGTPTEPTASDERNIPPRAQTAYEQYRQAADAIGKADPTDREAYDKLAKAYETAGEAGDLPSFATWRRNLTEYRTRTGTQKNTSRAERVDPAARFPKVEDIEPQSLPDRVRPRWADE